VSSNVKTFNGPTPKSRVGIHLVTDRTKAHWCQQCKSIILIGERHYLEPIERMRYHVGHEPKNQTTSLSVAKE